MFFRIDFIELCNLVGAEICGVTVTFSCAQKGCSGGKGSSLNTSNVHLDSLPLSRASRRSLSSINPPLPALISIAPFLTNLKCSATGIGEGFQKQKWKFKMALP